MWSWSLVIKNIESGISITLFEKDSTISKPHHYAKNLPNTTIIEMPITDKQK